MSECQCPTLHGVPIATKGCPEHGAWADLCKDMPKGTMMFINTKHLKVDVPGWERYHARAVIPQDPREN